MRKVWAVVVVLAFASLAGCGGGGGSETGTDGGGSGGASPQQLTNAYGEIAGVCLASEFAGGLKYKERAAMRSQLQLITETAEVAPATKSTDRQTSEEILFDLVPILNECDEALALEAEIAVGG